MGAIFSSHSSKDDSVAAELKCRLENEGHRSVFLDFDPEQGIPPGRDWERELYRQLHERHRGQVFILDRFICFSNLTIFADMSSRPDDRRT